MQNAADAGAEGIEFAVAGDFAFREYRNQFARGERGGDFGKGFFHQCRVFFGRCNRNGAPRFENEGQDGPAENMVVHDEANWAPASRGDDQGVNETDVVADQQGGAFRWNPVDVLLFQLVD